MALKLMYITNKENVAKIAEDSGVDWIFIDLEINGKEERQGHLDTVISRHHIEDVKKVRSVLTKAELLVRVNPIFDGSEKEIDKVIGDGADIVMLPFFKTKSEVKTFIDYVGGRTKTCLLCETAEAVENIDEILELKGIDLIHIGLNDLHLAYKMNFMFELLADGTVEMLCNKFRAKGIPYGFGGIAQLRQGDLPAEYVIAEHQRLGSSMAILSRSFCNVNKIDNINTVKDVFARGVREIKNYEHKLQTKDTSFFEHNRVIVKNKVMEIESNIDKGKKEGSCMKLLLTGAFKYSQEQLNMIQSLGYEVTFVQDERVLLDIDVSDFDAVVCNSLFLYNDITRFKNLKFIQLTSAGLDRVPLEYIKEKGIKLFNAKGVYSVPMAEWVVLKILEIYKKSRQFYKNQDECKWNKQRDLLELTDKTAAIIGFGSVGYEVAKRLKAFDVKVIGVGRKNLESDLLDEYYLIDDIDEVLNKSDIVILTLPLTEETRHLIGRDKIKNMKDNSVLVNVSRGGVIDEADLIEAIKSRKFLGVALDVFENEPLEEESLLWDMDDVVIFPHNSFVGDNNEKRLISIIVNNLKSYCK